MTHLAALERLYGRELADGSTHYSEQPVDFVLVLDAGGRVARVEDRRHHLKQVRSGRMIAPTPPRRTGSAPEPNLFWDKSDYVLGLGPSADATQWKGKTFPANLSEEERQGLIKELCVKAQQYRDRFVAKNLALLEGTEVPALVAFRRFLTRWDPSHFHSCIVNDEVRNAWTMLAFEDEAGLRMIHDEVEAIAIVDRARDEVRSGEGICLVSGRYGPLARTQHALSIGLKDKPTISSFNEDAFTSQGWRQGENSPISVNAELAVTEALAHLVRSGRSRRIGDRVLVFWAEAPSGEVQFEDHFLAACLGASSAADQEHETSTEVRESFRQMLDGVSASDTSIRSDVTVRVLLIGANSGRAIFHLASETGLKPFVESYQRMVMDLTIPGEPSRMRGHWSLARSFAPRKGNAYAHTREGEQIQIVTDAHEALVRAGLADERLPHWMLPQMLHRIARDGHVGAERIAIICAAIRRSWRHLNTMGFDANKDIFMLSKKDMTPAWHAGRIFATLEKIQDDAIGSTGAGIAVKFLGQAAARPSSILSRLILSARQRHLPKLLKGRAGSQSLATWSPEAVAAIGRKAESVIAESLEMAGPLPSRCSPEEQGLFLLGYYTERSLRFAKKTEETTKQEDAIA